MFTYTATAFYTDGTSLMYADGYAASGADELAFFHLGVLERLEKDAAALGKVLSGYQLMMVIG